MHITEISPRLLKNLLMQNTFSQFNFHLRVFKFIQFLSISKLSFKLKITMHKNQKEQNQSLSYDTITIFNQFAQFSFILN